MFEMMQCARYGELDEMVAYLNDGVPIVAADSNGTTALHYGSANGHCGVVNELLSRGANVNACNSSGNTSLHWASLNGHVAVVEALLRAGAAPDVKNNAGRTPVEEAESRGHLDILMAFATIAEGSLPGEHGDVELGGEDDPSNELTSPDGV